ncbi:hypothetical protein Dcar01_03761 [Deinococcus carri]|uniref:DUF305 domain-containing protein n=2 Tax=Deinococcus carri TaxID=1211323 RepID=A0ABP9WCD7_9DEIO
MRGLAAGLLGVALLSSALALGWPRPPAEGSAAVTFARDMSAHHVQAVDMSVTLFKRAADPAVKLLAQDVILTQQAQIGQMQGWLMAWGRPLAGRDAPMAGMERASMGLASPAEERELQHLPVSTAETRYLVLLRRHHQGGVAMAKSALRTVQRPEVQAFAKRMVAAQTSEIKAIDALLARRMAGGQPAQPEMDGMAHE